MNTQTPTSLAPQNISQVTITPEQQNYILSQLLSEKDSVMIRGKRFLNRSGCRKIALYLNINTEVIREERKEIEDGVFIYDFTVRASTPLGRYTEASASCNSTEREFTHLDNDVRATS